MNFILFYVLAAVFIVLSSVQFPGICRVEKDKVYKFLRFMWYVTLVRVVVYMLLSTPNAAQDPNSPMNKIELLSILGVYWEDAFFTLPILILERLKVNKAILIVLLGFNAISFALGHLSYGLLWAAITLLYVPFISYKYGKLNGLGTVMVCHILYDLITLITLRHILP
jgi:membrane protease YdiL (CAAX protease family)